MSYKEFTTGIGAPINRGEIVKSRSITRISELEDGRKISETYRTKKKFAFVFLVIGFEQEGQPAIDPTKALEEMGFVPKKRR